MAFGDDSAGTWLEPGKGRWVLDVNEAVLTEFVVKIGIHYGGMLCSRSTVLPAGF